MANTTTKQEQPSKTCPNSKCGLVTKNMKAKRCSECGAYFNGRGSIFIDILKAIGILVLLLAIVWFALWAFGTPMHPFTTTAFVPAASSSAPAPASATPAAPASATPAAPASASPVVSTAPFDVNSLGSISINGKKVAALDQGDRLYWSAGWELFGHAAPYDKAEMAKIESTWLDINVSSTASGFVSFFGYSIKTSDNTIYTPGALLLLTKGGQTFTGKGLNFEIVVWKDYFTLTEEVKSRITTEIENGNLSIDRPLAFSWVSKEFEGFVPQDLIDARKVKSVELIGK